MSLPVSATHVDDRYFIDLRRDGVPFSMRHEDRDIDPLMDDLVYNLIDVIQEEAERTELRTFFANIMSDRDWRNRDFEDLATNVGYWVGLGLRSGRFRDEREALGRGLEEFVQMAAAAMVQRYPELDRYLDDRMMRTVDKAIDMYDRILDEIDRYRRGDRRDRDYRGRDRDDRPRRGRDDLNDRRNRRDRYDRSAITGYRGSSPDRTDNRYAGSDQSDRFADASPTQPKGPSETGQFSPDGETAGRVMVRRPEVYRNPSTGGYPFTPPNPNTAEARTTMPNITVHTETPDQVGAAMPEGTKILPIDGNIDLYVPSLEHPHPEIWNSKKMLYLAAAPGAKSFDYVVGENMDYNRHHSLAFGDLPKELDRYRDEDGISRAKTIAQAMQEPLYTLEEPNPEGGDQANITLHLERMGELKDLKLYGLNLDELFTSMQILRTWANDQAKAKSDRAEPIHAYIADGFISTSFCTSEAERRVVDEIRQAQSYYKVIEILKGATNVLTPGNWRMLDEYFACHITRILKHCLSTKLSITTFVGDFKDLLGLLERDYGEAYRQFILEKQAEELAAITNYDSGCLGHFDTRFTGADLFSPSLFSIPVRMLYLNALSFDLGFDTIPDVGCRITSQASPEFETMVKRFEAPGKRRYVMTADHRILEIANSYVHEPTQLIRLVK